MPDDRVGANSVKAELVLSSWKYNQLQHGTGRISFASQASGIFFPFFAWRKSLAIKY